MLWIVEGVDRTGKSSLCERLADEHGGSVLHFDRPRVNALEEYVEPLMTYVPGTGQNVFCDRFHVGEAVWSEMFGRESLMLARERLCIELFLIYKGALCLWAYRDESDLERACRDDGESIAGRAAEAQRAFQRETTRSLLPFWLYGHGRPLDAMTQAARRLESRCQGVPLELRAFAHESWWDYPEPAEAEEAEAA